MGMMQGYLEVGNSEDAIKESEEYSTVPINTGMAIVVPIAKILDTVDQPEFVEERAKWVIEKQKRAGYKPSSAGPIAAS